LTRGGPAYASDTIVSFIYKLAFVQGDIGQTAATSVLAFLALLIFSIIYVLFVFRGRI
jgi:multiple sugar transport system permease protein